ncbi:hypothetical protein BDM02DRAFT_3111790 [Thelephora ganbajun]|uniref:Uncharacterized protein n=1 Tax=Thelephora ganbajun TaxID=370292 RepID=A0ACB6ZMV5_THEGA|nr:hypothetical protein BDM02DRAFT_3111790 [Thelephora ganbajun]
MCVLLASVYTIFASADLSPARLLEFSARASEQASRTQRQLPTLPKSPRTVLSI